MAATISVDLNARIAQFETEMKRATRSLDSFGKRGDAVASGLTSAFKGLAAGLTVGVLASFAKSGIDAADALAKLSSRTGVAVKDLAAMQLAADSADTSMDDVGKAMMRLRVSIGDAELGNKQLAESLQRLGVTSKDPKVAFEQLADAVKSSNDPTKTASDLSKVLGKSYANLIPLLQQGGEALREAAKESETFADAMARLAPNAEKFNDELDKLKNRAAGAAANGLVPLVEALNRVIDRFETLGRLRNAGASLFEIFTGGVSADVNKSLARVNQDIAAMEARKKRLGDTRDPATEAELTRLKALRSEYHALAVERDMAPPETETQRLLKQNRGGVGSVFTPPSKSGTGKTGKTSDPLASLLGQTDIKKLEEFDRMVALLNRRFDNGRKNTELYNQAMTRLVETTFASNFSDFNKQQADLADIEKEVADHLKATTDEIYAQQQAWMDAGKALEDDMRTPLENANIEFGRLQDLLDRGAISWETYTRAVLKTQDAIEETPDKLAEMDVFAKKAAENIQQSFADFLFDPFDKGLKGMLQGFGQMVQRMIADAVAADLARSLFGDLSKGGSGDGAVGGWLKAIGTVFGFADGGVAAYGRPVSLPRFAGGGVSNSAAIFGEAGPEAAVPLPDGRSIPVKMMGGGGNTYIVNVNGSNNAPDVRRAAGQGMREALGMMNGAQRYA